MDVREVVVIGGGFAGLAAAVYLARARRRVLVIDSGAPRNRLAAHSHGVFALDGKPGAELLETARSQLLAYPTAELLKDRAQHVQRQEADLRFVVETASQRVFSARRLILATGLSDVLPTIPGVESRWGTSVFHCPYCDGYEVDRAPLGVLATLPMSVHFAKLVAEWGRTTLYLNGAIEVSEADRADLERRGVEVEERRVDALEGATSSSLDYIKLADGHRRPAKALFIATLYRQAATFAVDLGCELSENPRGALVRTDEAKMTTVPWVYAAGDMARPTHSIPFATSDGVIAGVSAHQSLVME